MLFTWCRIQKASERENKVKHGGLPFQLQPKLATKFFRLIYSHKLNIATKALRFHDNSNKDIADWWWIQTTYMA